MPNGDRLCSLRAFVRCCSPSFADPTWLARRARKRSRRWEAILRCTDITSGLQHRAEPGQPRLRRQILRVGAGQCGGAAGSGERAVCGDRIPAPRGVVGDHHVVAIQHIEPWTKQLATRLVAPAGRSAASLRSISPSSCSSRCSRSPSTSCWPSSSASRWRRTSVA